MRFTELQNLNPEAVAEQARQSQRQRIADWLVDCGRDSDKPQFLLAGPASSGKDFAASFLQAQYHCRYRGSLSTFLVSLVAHEINCAYEDLFAERHEHRMFLFRFANQLRKSDPSLLLRIGLAGHDFAVGTRSKVEMVAAAEEKLIAASVWIENPTVGADPTLEFTQEDCDLVIYNDPRQGTEPFYKRLSAFAALLGLQPRS